MRFSPTVCHNTVSWDTVPITSTTRRELHQDCEPQPHRDVVANVFGDRKVVKLSCGTNHVACFTQRVKFDVGIGRYGRLGHRVQKDEFAPKMVDIRVATAMVPERRRIRRGIGVHVRVRVARSGYARRQVEEAKRQHHVPVRSWGCKAGSCAISRAVASRSPRALKSPP